MNEKLESLFTLFKKDQLTKYVVEREIANYLGEDFTVKIVENKKNIASKSFCVYIFPEKLTQGFHITMMIDEDAIKNIYTEEDFAVVLSRLQAKKQQILKKYNAFLKETKKKDISYNFALGFILDLYTSYRSDLSVRNGEYLPDDGDMIKYAQLFTMEDGTRHDIEKLTLEEIVCPEMLEFVKRYVQSGNFADDEPIFGAKAVAETPTFNFGQQELKKHSTSTFGIRNHKEIPYNYLPDTN